MRIGGLSSGFDIDNIVKDLMRAERIPLDRLFQRKVLAEWRREEYRSVNTKLLSMRDTSFNMRLQSTYLTRAANSSNPAVVSATTTGNSQVGTFEIKVTELAETAKLSSVNPLSKNGQKIDPTKSLSSQKDSFDNFNFVGEFTFELNGKSFTIDPNKDTLNSVLDKINKDVELGINAFYDSYQDKVVFTTKATGASAQITINDDSGGDFLINTLKLGHRVEPPTGIAGDILEVAKDEVKARYQFEFAGLNEGEQIKIQVGEGEEAVEYTLTVGEGGLPDSADSSIWFKHAIETHEELSKLWHAEINEDGTAVTLTAKEGSAADNGTEIAIEHPESVTLTPMPGEEAVAQVNTLTFLTGSIVAGLKVNIGDRVYAVYDSSDPATYGTTDEEAKAMLGADLVLDINKLENPGDPEEAKNAFLEMIAVDSIGENITGATVDWDGVNTLTITASESGLAGAGAAGYYVGMADNDIKVSGSNAKVVINGLETERESNTFELNDTRFTLHESSNGQTIRIDINQDVDKALDNIMDFVNKYNELIEQLNGMYREPRYREFLPLTDEQKEAMSEKEIEKWEAQARSGILRGDQLINGILSDMRLALMSNVEGLDGDIINLSQIGITTGAWHENGKLHVNETKLRQALQENPEQVMALFNNNPADDDPDKDKKLGVARKLYNSINNGIERIAIRAGRDAVVYDQSFLGNEIRRYEQRMDAMEDRLRRVEDRYWRQFTAMEKALNQMYSQSDWLYQQLMAMQ